MDQGEHKRVHQKENACFLMDQTGEKHSFISRRWRTNCAVLTQWSTATREGKSALPRLGNIEQNQPGTEKYILHGFTYVNLKIRHNCAVVSKVRVVVTLLGISCDKTRHKGGVLGDLERSVSWSGCWLWEWVHFMNIRLLDTYYLCIHFSVYMLYLN